jgi:hypothetical protein
VLDRGRRTAGATVVDRTEKQKARLAALVDVDTSTASEPSDENQMKTKRRAFIAFTKRTVTLLRRLVCRGAQAG